MERERERERERDAPAGGTGSKTQPRCLWRPLHGDAVTWSALWWRAPQAGPKGGGEAPFPHQDHLWAQAGTTPRIVEREASLIIVILRHSQKERP